LSALELPSVQPLCKVVQLHNRNNRNNRISGPHASEVHLTVRRTLEKRYRLKPEILLQEIQFERSVFGAFV